MKKSKKVRMIVRKFLHQWGVKDLRPNEKNVTGNQMQYGQINFEMKPMCNQVAYIYVNAIIGDLSKFLFLEICGYRHTRRRINFN